MLIVFPGPWGAVGGFYQGPAKPGFHCTLPARAEHQAFPVPDPVVGAEGHCRLWPETGGAGCNSTGGTDWPQCQDLGQ